jgi:hypothetical protein
MMPISDCGSRIADWHAWKLVVLLISAGIEFEVMDGSPQHNPQSEIRDPQSPFTDSPWFWVLMFSLMALGALVAIGGKYGRRQSAIERQYQARERVAERQVAGHDSAQAERNEFQQASPRDFASPDDTLIPLWPLASLLGVVALFAAFMLFRGRGRPGSLNSERVS